MPSSLHLARGFPPRPDGPGPRGEGLSLPLGAVRPLGRGWPRPSSPIRRFGGRRVAAVRDALATASATVPSRRGAAAGGPVFTVSLSVAGVCRAAALGAAACLRGVAAAVPLAAVLLSGCGERREETRLAAIHAGLASAQASLAVLSPAGSAPAPRAAAGLPIAAVHPSPGRAAAATAAFGPPGPVGARPVAASELLGAGPDALRRWFGEPDLRRAEGDAEVLLFLGPGCALDVVLYPDAGAARVAHAAARAEGAAAVTEAECLRGLGAGGGGEWTGRTEVGRAAAVWRTLPR